MGTTILSKSASFIFKSKLASLKKVFRSDLVAAFNAYSDKK
jgi:hypothetical protein